MWYIIRRDGCNKKAVSRIVAEAIICIARNYTLVDVRTFKGCLEMNMGLFIH